MGRQLLDEHTADRLLSGVLAPEDAPPGYAGVATLLQAASAPPTPQEIARCQATVAAMARAVAASPAASTVPFVKTRRRAGLSRLLRPRIAATLTAGALALFGSLGAAGALPAPLQHAAHVAFGAVGIHVPDSGDGTTEGPTGPAHATTGRGVPSSRDDDSTGARGHGAGKGHGKGRGHGRGRDHGVRGRGHGRGNGHGKGHGHHKGHHGHDDGRHGHGEDGLRQGGGTNGGSSDESGGAHGPKGLCNAYFRGKGGERGKKYSATAFRRLEEDAAAHGMTVEEYCSGASTHEQSDGQGDGKGGRHGHRGGAGNAHEGEKQNQHKKKGGNDGSSGADTNSGGSGDHGGGGPHGDTASRTHEDGSKRSPGSGAASSDDRS